MAAIDSVAALVAQAVGLQTTNAQQDVQNSLLKKTLDGQKDAIMSLVQGVTGPQKLADSGVVGTQLHTAA